MIIIIIIQFNSLFIYVLTQQPYAFYRVSTDTYNTIQYIIIIIIIIIN
jgi:hypothetical protein